MFTNGATLNGRITPEYHVWITAKARCFNPKSKKFPIYGGRGITMCDEWRASFAAFLRDMGRRPALGLSIERIDNDGPYDKDNCKWATRAEQARNRRNNVMVVVDGQRMTAQDACVKNGLPPHTAACRIHRGWTPQDAVSIPLGSPRRSARTDKGAAYVTTSIQELSA